MEALISRVLDGQVEGAINMRDLGGHATPAGRVRSGRVFRSAMTHHLTHRGMRTLSDELGIRIVVDFRSESEIAADGLAPFGVHGIGYRHLPIAADTALTPEDRRERILAIRDGDVSWVELYRHLLVSGMDSFAALFHEVADEAPVPLLFHCTGGRDRTGIAAALLLSVLGVSDDDVANDYALTGSLLASHTHRFERNRRELGMTPDEWQALLATTTEPIHSTLDFIRTEFGSVDGYLNCAGAGSEVLERLRWLLVE